jgi:hypothetical protein
MRNLLLASLCLPLLVGCAGMNDLPATAAEVNFDGEQGHTGWARYERTVHLKDTRLSAAIEAGERALAFSKFEIRKVDPAGAVVVGEHGATPYDYNIMAAIYFRQEGKDVRSRIHVQASRDIGFLGDATERNWTKELETSLKAILNR